LQPPKALRIRKRQATTTIIIVSTTIDADSIAYEHTAAVASLMILAAAAPFVERAMSKNGSRRSAVSVILRLFFLDRDSSA